MTATKQPIQPIAQQLLRLEEQQAKRLNRAAIGVGIFFVGWVVAIYSSINNISNMGLTPVIIGVIFSFSTQVLLLYILKTGRNLRFNDPNLTTIQLLNAIFWVSIAMIFMPEIKGVMAFFSFVCLLYTVFHTTKLTLILLPLTSILGLAIADYFYYIRFPEEFNFQYEAIEFAVFSLSTVWISIIAKFSLTLRNRLQQQRQEILLNNQLLALQNEQDPLTGLKNRRFFNEKFTEEYKRASRNHSPLSLIMVDLDNFKIINDTHGHDAGDECLKFIANLLTKEVNRTGDILARYGGEEFVILLPNTTSAKAFQLANQLKNKIENCTFDYESSEKITLKLTASFGVSGVNEQGVVTQDELLISADKALYKAKDLGRNQVQLYHTI